MYFEDVDDFNCVIDKGTLDSVLCGLNSTANARKMLTQIFEYLAPNGVYICVSYGVPETRLEFLDIGKWSKDGYEWKVIEHT